MLQQGKEYPYGHYLRIMLQHLKLRLDGRLAPFGITGQQARVLEYIQVHEDRGEQLRQKDLERMMNLRGSSVTSLIHGLEKRGFIIRAGGEADGRVKRLILTDRGRRLHDTFREVFSGMEETIVAGMTPGERRTFLRLLQKAAVNLEQGTRADAAVFPDTRQNRNEVENEQEAKGEDT